MSNRKRARQSSERVVASMVQAVLERVYQVERVADVCDFVRKALPDERETVLLREALDGAVEISVRLPRLREKIDLDTLCQVIEGVSHFVCLVHRIQANRTTTQLELEMQAEVDKWVVLAGSRRTLDPQRSERVRRRLYGKVTFAHGAGTELGERYRIANDAAEAFVRRLEREFVTPGYLGAMHRQLQRFFRVGQAEKLRLGRVA